MTEAQKKKYLENPTQCPMCESGDIVAGHADFDGTVCSQSVECEDCGYKWQDIYRLSDVEEDEELDDDENEEE